MSDWKEVNLKKIAAIQQGYAFKSKDFNDEEGMPVIKIKNISSGKVDLKETQFFSKDVTNLVKYYASKGDILIAMTGSHLDQPTSVVGRVSKYNYNFSSLLNQRTAKIIPIESIVNKLFIYYSLILDETLHILASNASGSANQANISSEQIYNLPILLPSLPEQESIAEVLSSLDNKIDLLHRNNKTLEQLAETYFRQWFVEEVETKPVKYFGKIICGKTPPKNNNNFFNGPIPFLKIPDMHGKAFVFKTTDSLTDEGKQSQSNKTIPPFSISVSCIATVGLVTINAFECQTNQQINSIVPNEKNYRYYLYNYFKSITDDLIQRASSGSVTHNLNTSDFSNIEIPFFSDDLFTSFDDVVDPLYQKVFTNEQQIQQLETLRDTLLPKLMSGAVRVN